MKVLIVDDEEMNCKAIQRLLRLEDYEVVYFTSPLDALKEAEKNSFDIILLDILMPVMNGIELCSNLRNISHIKDVPIIILSAKSDKQFKEDVMEKGANAYILKPINSEELLSKMKELIKGSKSDNPEK